MDDLRSHPLAVFEKLESEVRIYGRDFPAVFDRAKGAEVFDIDGRRFIDFFAGAGALNYGHNPDSLKQALIAYLQRDGITHALDKYTAAKAAFLEGFASTILEPRGLDYKIQFCGPTGANGVEAALKLARKITSRTGVFAFSGAYHGMTQGTLAVSGNRRARAGAGVPLANTTFVPYPDGPHGTFDSIGLLRRYIEDPSSGVDTPAAILLETVQLEGGVYVAPSEFLVELRKLCDEHEILLICDDIQAGCGRSGAFFSFERAKITPDITVLSKSVSGYGIPMTVVLMKRGADAWRPGEHTGTFRAHQLALVTAHAALQHWTNGGLGSALGDASRHLEGTIREKILGRFPEARLRGLGMAWGLDLGAWPADRLERAQAICFERGLLIERCGRRSEVMKVLPPLVISKELVDEGCGILADAMHAATKS